MSGCPHAPSGCNYPEGECIGACMPTYEPTPTCCTTPRQDCMGMLVASIGNACAAMRNTKLKAVKGGWVRVFIDGKQ
jgi:hypothetical protein